MVAGSWACSRPDDSFTHPRAPYSAAGFATVLVRVVVTRVLAPQRSGPTSRDGRAFGCGAVHRAETRAVRIRHAVGVSPSELDGPAGCTWREPGALGLRQLSQTLVRLNVETRSFHEEADAPWNDLMTAGRTRFDYVQHLVQRYGFDAPLEAALAYTPHLDSFIEVTRHFRAGLIAKDLLTLGVRAVEVAHLQQAMIAPFASVAEAFGWLYVHERAALLQGAQLTQLLVMMPDVEPATSSLRRYDGHVGAYWDDLGHCLYQVSRTPEIEERIIAAAKDGFRLLIEWHRRALRDTPQAKSS